MVKPFLILTTAIKDLIEKQPGRISFSSAWWLDFSYFSGLFCLPSTVSGPARQNPRHLHSTRSQLTAPWRKQSCCPSRRWRLRTSSVRSKFFSVMGRPDGDEMGQGEAGAALAGRVTMRASEPDVHEAIASFCWVKVPGDRENLPVEPGENPGCGRAGLGLPVHQPHLKNIFLFSTFVVTMLWVMKRP